MLKDDWVVDGITKYHGETVDETLKGLPSCLGKYGRTESCYFQEFL